MLGPQDHFSKSLSGIVENVVHMERDDGQRDMIGKGGKIRTNNTTVARPSQSRAGPRTDSGRGIEGCENPRNPAMPTHTIHPCHPKYPSTNKIGSREKAMARWRSPHRA